MCWVQQLQAEVHNCSQQDGCDAGTSGLVLSITLYNVSFKERGTPEAALLMQSQCSRFAPCVAVHGCVSSAACVGCGEHAA
jgi:hypothetical protein